MEHDDKYIYLFKVISLVFKKKYIFKNKPTKETLSSWMNPTPFKYPTGQELQKHTDKLPSPFQNMITLIFYLNDDYSGGEFCMEKNNKDVLIKPKMGDIIAIDNDTVHGSKKVITGNKYIAIFQFEAIMK